MQNTLARETIVSFEREDNQRDERVQFEVLSEPAAEQSHLRDTRVEIGK